MDKDLLQHAKNLITAGINNSDNPENMRALARQNLILNQADPFRSIFSTSVMIDSRLETGLEVLFVNRSEYNSNTAEISYDVMTSADVMSVNKDRNFNENYDYNQECEYVNYSFVTPIIKEELRVNAARMLIRRFGNAPCNDNVPIRAAVTEILNRQFVKIMNKIKRNIKWQGYEMLQFGKIDFSKIGSDAKSTDNIRSSELTATVSKAWSDPTANILGDLKAMIKKVKALGKARVNVIILGDNAQTNFLNNNEISKIFDNRGYQVGDITPTERQNQAYDIFGQITLSGKRILLATPKDETYIDPTDKTTVKDYFDPDHVVLIDDRSMDARSYFGAVEMFAGTGEFSFQTSNMNISRLSISGLTLSNFNSMVLINGRLDDRNENILTNFQSAPLAVLGNPNATALLITKI